MKNIRNIAVIAHVDHGKTTLVDAILKQTKVFRDHQGEMKQERILDRNDLERERGITILAKNCSVEYSGYKINIIDTPGHVDFSGEVERTLSMADGALLIVDAAEGPMPQTRSVLKQALTLGLNVIVVINKVDKQFANAKKTRDEIETLFLELATNEEQLNFPVLYAIGRSGAVSEDIDSVSDEGDVKSLLETILTKVKAPEIVESEISKLLVTSMEYDSHVGRIMVGKLRQGSIKKGENLYILQNSKRFTVEHLYTYEGLGRVEVKDVEAGDVVAISGAGDIQIGMTISSSPNESPYPAPLIGEPTLHITVGANSSPFVGRDGKFVNSRQIEERLEKELESNLSLRVEKLGSGKYRVSGRGELHLSVLLETMRREGYEMEVGKPEVIEKNVGGKMLEPWESVEIIVPKEYEGVVHQEAGRRFALVKDVKNVGENEVKLTYEMATRATLGLRSILLTETRGTLLYSSEFLKFDTFGKNLPKMRSGVVVSSHSGQALAYGLRAIQVHAETFIAPGEEVYEGMIVGVSNRDEDMRMNVTKGKQLTNMRSKSSDGVIQLAPPTLMSLEQCLDFLEADELVEITPSHLRLRKKKLTVK